MKRDKRFAGWFILGILEEFSSGIDVELMPGENDPANQIMPQQPLHCCLFPSK